jgi:hypothetical protein
VDYEAKMGAQQQQQQEEKLEMNEKRRLPVAGTLGGYGKEDEPEDAQAGKPEEPPEPSPLLAAIAMSKITARESASAVLENQAAGEFLPLFLTIFREILPLALEVLEGNKQEEPGTM